MAPPPPRALPLLGAVPIALLTAAGVLSAVRAGRGGGGSWLALLCLLLGGWALWTERQRARALSAERTNAAELQTRVAELQAKSSALQEQNRDLEAFSRTVSHDLRAPLRRIRGYSELLQKAAGGALPEKAGHCLEAIQDSATRADGLVERLLELAQVGHRPLVTRPVPLGTLVAELRRELAVDARERQVTWEVGALPSVSGDAVLLRQALQQLLTNALKYTRTRPQARIEVGARLEGEELVLHVRDNGVGFDMAEAAKLFAPFARLHPESQFEGHGVGLASVRRIAERHGGRTWAEARPEAGATFFFALPREVCIEGEPA